MQHPSHAWWLLHVSWGPHTASSPHLHNWCVLQMLHERVDAGLAAEAENRRRGDATLRSQLLDELESSRNELLQRSETIKQEVEAQAQTLAEEVSQRCLTSLSSSGISGPALAPPVWHEPLHERQHEAGKQQSAAPGTAPTRIVPRTPNPFIRSSAP